MKIVANAMITSTIPLSKSCLKHFLRPPSLRHIFCLCYYIAQSLFLILLVENPATEHL